MTIAERNQDRDPDGDDRQWLSDFAKDRHPEATAAEAALHLARLDDPSCDLASYQHCLDDLAADLERSIGDLARTNDQVISPRDLAIAFQNVIPGYHGFQGDEDNYDDVDNANLIRVLERRRGLPVALSLLYLHAAQKCGIDLVGIDFPGHFLLRLQAGSERVLIDPFHNGIILEAAELRELLKAFQGLDAELQPQHYREADDIAILLRLQNNIKVRALRNGDLAYAAEILDRCLLIAPDNAGLWHQIGTLYARLNQDQKALDAFNQFLKLNHDPRHQRRIMALVEELHERLNPSPEPTQDQAATENDHAPIPLFPTKKDGSIPVKKQSKPIKTGNCPPSEDTPTD